MIKKISTLFIGFLLFSSCNNLLVRFGNTVNKISERPKKSKKNYRPLPFSSVKFKKLDAVAFEDIPVVNINVSQLNELITSENNIFKYVAIYTSGCRGTPGELQYIKKSLETYENDVKFYLISSDNIAPYLIQMLQKKLYSNNFFYPTYIIDHNIKSFLDDRKRGELFRNEICSACKTDIIGVPYVILFNNENEIIFHGYRGYKTDIPADIIKYFTGK